jgi:hypothetical protein
MHIRVLTKICILSQQSVLSLPSSTTDADVQGQELTKRRGRFEVVRQGISAKLFATPTREAGAKL